MKPYTDEALNRIYDLLFCDDTEAYRAASTSTDPPWSVLFDRNATNEELHSLIDDNSVETRPKLLASNILLGRGEPLPARRIFGVVVEVGMDEGLDVLAAYEDGTARYLNYSGKIIVWEVGTRESKELVVDLFLAARKVVEQIGPWERKRLPPPTRGNSRISFLVSNGLYFGEAPFETLAKDPLGGRVIDRAAKLMNVLIRNATDQSR
jgi:hypothetical protein